MRYRFTVEYDGSAFYGWQLQKKGPTVQGALENALEILLREKTRVHGSGRTDTGVHARGQCAHFDTNEPVGDVLKFQRSINGLTGENIVVRDLQPADDDFHARFSATSRRYRYYIARRRIAIGRHYVWENMVSLDSRKINDYCEWLKAQTDFKAFTRSAAEVENYICTIKSLRWFEDVTGIFVFEIEANRFLHGMVRAIVGTLIKVGSGKMTLDEVKLAAESGDRRKLPMAAPAKGLVLEEIKY